MRRTLQSVMMTFLVIVGPVEAQFAYVCGMDAEPGMSMSCCEGHGLGMVVSPDCDMHPGEASEACMELTAADDADQSASSAGKAFQPVPEKPPPVAFAPLADLYPVSARAVSAFAGRSRSSPGTPGTGTYLTTLRLRI